MQISGAGNPNKTASQLRQRGMTLIELMVGMTILGVILSVVVGGIRSFSDAELKKASNKLSSTIRYLYNKSATERLYLRLAYDISENSYKVESSSEPFVVEVLTKEELEKKARDGQDDDAIPEHNPFSAEESYLLKPVKLGDDIKFADVQVSYLKARINGGIAYTYFLPNGFATPTIINLSDEAGEAFYSLEILPLSGRVRIETKHKDLHEDLE